jgi:lipid-binding SYLF domain-containing protein
MRLIVPAILILGVAIGCATSPKTAKERDSLNRDAQAAVTRFKETDPGMRTWFAKSHGYAVFPSVGKGGMGIGGAFGRGQVHEKGALVGYTTLTQATIGFQWGGQAYREVIFFENKAALDHFRSGTYELGAQASAVAATTGASADARFKNGVAVFTAPIGGLMYEATVGGQKFAYEAVKPNEPKDF